MSEATDNAVWRRILAAAPELADLFPRQPRYCYYVIGQRRFCWTTERMGDGKFAAFEYRPVGSGARTGKATSWKLTREVRFTTRVKAKARARKWYDTARSKEGPR